MAKRGEKRHLKRITAPKTIPVKNKKGNVWMARGMAGAHQKRFAIPLVILMREVLEVCRTAKEVTRVLHERAVQVDGRVRTDPRYSVGLMDVISFPKIKKYYRILINSKGKLNAVEIDEKEAGNKIGKVTAKYTVKKGQIMIRLHDGKNLKADKNVKRGDSVVVSIADNKIKELLKLQNGARCLVKDGKHAGAIATLEKIGVQREGGKIEAHLKSEKEEFITILDHLFVIDDSIKGVKQ